MIWTGRIASLAIVCVLIGATLPGKPALLVTLGSITFCLGQWIAVSRNRARRGKAEDFTFDIADITAMKGPDLLILIFSVLIGIGLFCAGLAMLPSGA